MGRRPVMVLGAGGAARAILHGLLAEGARRILLANRTSGRAEALAGAFGPAVTVVDWRDRNRALAGCGLLVNATSLGMTGKDPLDLDLASLPPDAVVADIVYSPLETALLAAARARGNRTVDGLGMLLHQAVPGFERWFGVRPAVTPALESSCRPIARREMMLVIGLTGGIGMGKSAAAAAFRRPRHSGVQRRCLRPSSL